MFFNKWFSSRSKSKNVHAPNPKSRVGHKQSKYAVDPLREIATMSEQLSFVHPTPERQTYFRKRAFMSLQNYDGDASSAIPTLINAYVKGSTLERDLAEETLFKIDPNWTSNPFCIEQVPFLISQLKRDRSRVKRAIHLFGLIGAPASSQLLSALTDRNNLDEHFCLNALRVFSSTPVSKEETIDLLVSVLEKGSSSLLIANALNMVGAHLDFTESQTAGISSFCDHVSPNVRLAAVKATGNQSAINEVTLNNLFGILADEEPNIRSAGIKALSSIHHPVAEHFYDTILRGNGALTEDDLEEIKNQFTFYAKAKAIKLGTLGFQYRWFASDWFIYEAQKALLKPGLIYESVRRIREVQEQKINSDDSKEIDFSIPFSPSDDVRSDF